MKKRIIKATKLFFIIVFVLLSNGMMFGPKNIIVGIGGVIGVVVFMNLDITGSSILGSIKLICLYICIGGLAFISSNYYLVSFIFLFLVAYISSYDLKSIKTIPVGLIYVFLVFSPIKISELPLRLMSLTYIGIIISIVQMVMNKKIFISKLSKNINSILIGVKKNVDYVLDRDNDKNKIWKLSFEINILKTELYRRRKSSLKENKDIESKMLVLEFIENLNTVICSINNRNINFEIKEILINIKLIIDTLILNKNIMSDEVYDAIDSLEINESKQYDVYKLNSIIIKFNAKLRDLYKENKFDYEKEEFGKSMFKKFDYEFKNFRFKEFILYNVRLNFALKYALVNSIAISILLKFNITRGLWLSLTMIILIQPYVELSKSRSVDRLKGTLIGVLIFEVVFLIPSNTIKIAFILISLYLLAFVKTYKFRICFVSICACAALTRIDPHISYTMYAMYRFLFTLGGALISMIAVYLVFPCSAVDMLNAFIDESKELYKELIGMIKCNKIEYEKFRNIKLKIKFIRSRISINNRELRNKGYIEFINIDQNLYLNINSLLKFLNEREENYLSNISKELNLSNNNTTNHSNLIHECIMEIETTYKELYKFNIKK